MLNNYVLQGNWVYKRTPFIKKKRWGNSPSASKTIFTLSTHKPSHSTWRNRHSVQPHFTIPIQTSFQVSLQAFRTNKPLLPANSSSCLSFFPTNLRHLRRHPYPLLPWALFIIIFSTSALTAAHVMYTLPPGVIPVLTGRWVPRGRACQHRQKPLDVTSSTSPRPQYSLWTPWCLLSAMLSSGTAASLWSPSWRSAPENKKGSQVFNSLISGMEAQRAGAASTSRVIFFK